MRRLHRIGLQEHDVMWIDEAAYQKPWLIELCSFCFEPIHCLEGGSPVKLLTLQWRTEHFTPLLEIRKAIAFERVFAALCLRQMPLAFERSVIALLTQKMTDRGNRGG